MTRLNPKNWSLPGLPGRKKKTKGAEEPKTSAGGGRSEAARKTPEQTVSQPRTHFSRPFAAGNPAPGTLRAAVPHPEAKPSAEAIGRYTSNGHLIPDALVPGRAPSGHIATDGLFMEAPAPPAPSRQALRQVALREGLGAPRPLHDTETTATHTRPGLPTSGPSPLSLVSTPENPTPHAAEKSHDGGMTYAELKPMRERLQALMTDPPRTTHGPKAPATFDDMDIPGGARRASRPDIPPAHKIRDDFGLV